MRRAALAAIAALCAGLTGCVMYLNPLCTDQIHNGDETGLDCGGSCGRCNLGEGCQVDADCDDANCKHGVCSPAACNDGVKGEAETDIDCGGGTCRKCAGGRSCQVAGDCFSGACDPDRGTCSQLAAIEFASEVRYASGFKSYAVFSGDLDGDGAADLAVANEYGSSVSVFLNDGAGGFTHLQNRAGTPEGDTFPNFPTGAYPTGGAIADFNHDGHPDVVTADYHGDSVSVLLNAGTGALDLRPTASYPTVAGAETSNLAVGDLDGDGNLDVVATNPQRASVSLFLGRADGQFAAAIDLPVGISGGAMPYSAAIGDFNGDHKNDLAIGEEATGTIVVRLGNGDGTFQPEVAYAIDGTRDYIVIASDVNRDGALDLLSANRGSSDVSVLLGRGDGTFRKAIVSSVAPGVGPYSIAVADINLDGVPDIVTANFMSEGISVLRGIGDGRFELADETKFTTAPLDATLQSTTPYGIAVIDVDGDGKPDLATANAGSYDLTIKRNTSH